MLGSRQMPACERLSHERSGDLRASPLFRPGTCTPVSAGPTPTVVVCVLTCRRPAGLVATLHSLRRQDCAAPFTCLVADNDPADALGAAAASEFFRDGRLSGAAVIVDRPGHCSASNGVFAAARSLYPAAPWIAMIDDDEVADPGWLRHLLVAQARSGADLVGGPVQPRFECGDAARFAAHPVFTPFFGQSGPVPFLYGSGNFLVRASVLDEVGQPLFDPAFDFTGGGDFDFFLRCRDLGFTAWFENAARATETVPAARTSLRWVLSRSMRYGTINYMIESRSARSRLRRLKVPLKSACLLGLAPIRAASRLFRSHDLLIASHPLMEALGRAVAPFGLRPEQYRAPR